MGSGVFNRGLHPFSYRTPFFPYGNPLWDSGTRFRIVHLVRGCSSVHVVRTGMGSERVYDERGTPYTSETTGTGFVVCHPFRMTTTLPVLNIDPDGIPSEVVKYVLNSGEVRNGCNPGKIIDLHTHYRLYLCVNKWEVQ